TGEVHSESAGFAAFVLAAFRRSDFFRIDTPEPGRVSRGNPVSRWRAYSDEACFSKPGRSGGTGTPEISESEPDGWSNRGAAALKIVCPKDRSSAGIEELVSTADSNALFVGDPQANVEPGPRMFDRMAQMVRETGAGWVYADAAGHPRIDYQR